ncbi:ATP-binding protein [Aureimonas sp. AU4]|uniref:ATP-binding protein n=1 Tax=Aureimonas sp. AU4 TaxID=1638163 RepID=UPI000705916A|nr:ATP-binding protein [Aureimonas sp. AU4]BAT30419.1 putative phosphate sensor histidine kinase [Aureimonas sp. AU4]
MEGEGEERRRRDWSALPAVLILAAGLLLDTALGGALPREAGLAILALGLLAYGLSGLWRRRRPAGGPTARVRTSTVWPDAGMRGVVEAVREPAFLVDRTLALRFRNDVSLTPFGAIAPGDPISLRFRSPDLLQAMEAAVATGEAQTTEFAERSPIDRSWLVDILPVRGAGGGPPPFLLLLFRDQTASRRLERMRTDFVANASHELRTPLASLTGFIETLKGPAREDAAARERFLDIMLEQSRRMSRLIDDLLSLSRIETRRQLQAGERADLAQVLRSVAHEIEPQAREAGVELTLVGLDADPIWVNGDTDELVQVFTNLAENAIKYGRDGGRIEIGIQPAPPLAGKAQVEALVRDFGKGIAPEHLPRLTERFYRVEGKTRERGTGLGLSIVRNVLIRHRTRLRIASEPGEGATFSVRFDRLDA